MAAARELTKKFEEVARGTIGELKARFEREAPRGEFTLVFGGRTREATESVLE
jgi:16S rRNA (cytidine1402-2'-O)-methyltransferase